MIIFDFEWNRGYDKKPLDEILQIGAVRVDRLGGPVTDTFNVYIRPVVHKKFDPGAKKLPELEASRRSQVDFPTAMECFHTWCGTETVFAAWGNDDLKNLERNCAYWNVPPLTAGETLDLQRFYIEKPGSDHADQIKDLDSRFHQLLYESSGSKAFYETLSTLHKKMTKFRKASVSRHSRAVESLAEHEAIYEALSRHDGEAARQLTQRHNINARDSMTRVEE